jgi:hypothetical protein
MPGNPQKNGGAGDISPRRPRINSTSSQSIIMGTQILNIVLPLVGSATGAGIGLAFGLLQNAAQQHNQERLERGDLRNTWSLMPGAGVRVAYLLITLAVIQAFFPVLFADGVQWWVSGGLVAGYGYTLFMKLRRKLSMHE